MLRVEINMTLNIAYSNIWVSKSAVDLQY
jgi:hypothetical protein